MVMYNLCSMCLLGRNLYKEDYKQVRKRLGFFLCKEKDEQFLFWFLFVFFLISILFSTHFFFSVFIFFLFFFMVKKEVEEMGLCFFKGRFFILLARVFLFSLFIVKTVLSSFPIYSSNLTFSCLAFYLAVFLFNFFFF